MRSLYSIVSNRSYDNHRHSFDCTLQVEILVGRPPIWPMTKCEHGSANVPHRRGSGRELYWQHGFGESLIILLRIQVFAGDSTNSKAPIETAMTEATKTSPVAR